MVGSLTYGLGVSDETVASLDGALGVIRANVAQALADAERRTWERAIQFIDRLTIPDGWEDGHGWDAVLDYAVTKMREAAQGVLNK